MKLKLTKEQIKIRAFGEEFNRKSLAKSETESAQDIIDVLPNLNKQQQDFILMRENE